MTAPARQRGVTLVELIVVLGITSLLVTLVVAAMIDLDRSRRPREVTAAVQGEGRQGLSILENDLRAGSLGAGTGRIWLQTTAGVEQRPAVQIFDRIRAGTELVPAKPGTDALLVVRAEQDTLTAPIAATVGDTYVAGSLTVTSSAGFSEGDAILFGEYADAAWDSITRVNGQILLTKATQVVFPGSPQVQKLSAGSFVRRARARLYYVNGNDELVRVNLRAPRAPQSKDDLDYAEAVVLARGVENLQVDCVVANGNAFAGCPAPMSDVANPVVAESQAAFGDAASGSGPRFDAGSIGTLRSVSLSIVLRSVSPLQDGQGAGDPPIPLVAGEDALRPGGAPVNAPYIRRVYRIGLAIRNTSLGVL